MKDLGSKDITILEKQRWNHSERDGTRLINVEMRKEVS